MRTLSVAHLVRSGMRAVPVGVRLRVKKALPTSLKLKLWQVIVRLNPADGVFVCDDGRKFEHTTDGVFARVLLEGAYEAELSAVARSVLRPGDAAIDAGANFGWYTTLFAQAVGSEGAVYSFEPVPDTFERLSRNVNLNEMASVVSAHNVAVGSADGWVDMSSGVDSSLAFATKTDGGTTAVAVKRVDDLVVSHMSDVALFKIDVEGFEDEVLRGAEALLASEHPPVVQIEVNDEALARAGSSRKAVLARLLDAGYALFHVGKRQQLEPATDDATDIFARPPHGKFKDRLASA